MGSEVILYCSVQLHDDVSVDSPRIDCRQLTAAGVSSSSDVIECDPLMSYSVTSHVIECDVTAKPAVTNMFWIIDDNGTTITDSSTALADIWTTSAVSDVHVYYTVSQKKRLNFKMV